MPGRKWGQHFLRDEATARRIAAAAGVRPGETVLEIGPGTGRLTRALLATAGRVLAVEIDAALAVALPGRVGAPGRLEVVQADAAAIDLGALLRARLPPAEKARAVGSLPYESGTPILLGLLAARERLAGIAVVVQREVADRIVARPGDRAYGLLSVLCQDVADARLALHLPPGCFQPPPAVRSALVVLLPRPAPRRGAVDPEEFRRFVGGLFERRRKTVLNNLRAHRGLDREAAEASLRRAGIGLDRRPQDLAVEAFAALLRDLPG